MLASAGVLSLSLRGSPVSSAELVDALEVQFEDTRAPAAGASVAAIDCPSSLDRRGGPDFSQVCTRAAADAYLIL